MPASFISGRLGKAEREGETDRGGGIGIGIDVGTMLQCLPMLGNSRVTRFNCVVGDIIARG